MKTKTKFKIILILIITFFELQFLSQLFYSIAPKKASYQNSRFFKVSALLFPIDADMIFQYAYSILEESVYPPNKQMIEKSIQYFEKAIGCNMLYYNAHFYLGKAYLSLRRPNSTDFNQALKAFKKAAIIRGKNVTVGMVTLKLFLSLWPHLNDEDKRFCKNIINKIIKNINNNDIKSLLNTWGLYVRDTELLKYILKMVPKYYNEAAIELANLEIELELRQTFLTNYDIYALELAKERYRKIQQEEVGQIKKFKSLYNWINKRIKGYHTLSKNITFREKDLYGLKKRIILSVLQLLFAEGDWRKNINKRKELLEYIIKNINDITSRKTIIDIDVFLKQKKFFDFEDLRIFYIKQLINFKLGRFDTVINDTEILQQSISFVKKENMTDYVNILFLLADSYISSRLLSRALPVLGEIEKISPGLIKTYWRKMKIERILGPEEAEDEKKKEKYELIKKSNQIELNSLSIKKIVYFLNENVIEIKIKEPVKEKMESKHVLQIFINNRIRYEAYLGQINFPIKITIPGIEKYSKHLLEIKII